MYAQPTLRERLARCDKPLACRKQWNVCMNTTILNGIRCGILAMLASVAVSPSLADGQEAPGFLRRTFYKLTWDEIQAVEQTPKEISQAVRRQVRYREDVGEEWAAGSVTWKRAAGDCEDLAQCVIELCQARGYDASMYILYPEGSLEAHAVAIGMQDGTIAWMSSNGWYEKIDSLDEAKRLVQRERNWKPKQIMCRPVSAMKNELAATVPRPPPSHL